MPPEARVPGLAALVAIAQLAAGCASSGPAVPRPFPMPPRPPATATAPPPEVAAPVASPPVAAPLPSPLSSAIVESALELTGAPYRDRGEDPRGFDCSGFVTYVFGRHGIRLPRTVAQMYGTGAPVPPGEVAPGDLLFFTTTGPGATHVGIALGDGGFVHAPSERGRVRTERLNAQYWAARYLGARRMATAAGM
jgi:cell wall-associated NlpC family hydrolase